MVTLIEKFLAGLYQVVRQILAKNMLDQMEVTRNKSEYSSQIIPQTRQQPIQVLDLTLEPFQPQLEQKQEL